MVADDALAEEATGLLRRGGWRGAGATPIRAGKAAGEMLLARRRCAADDASKN
jgi:hypothetical protein